MADPSNNERGTQAQGSAHNFAADLAHDFGGAIIFSIPLLMTMEMWWLGFYMDRFRLALYEGGLGDSLPPDVTVQLEEIIPAQDGFLVTFRVVNAGGTNAAGLTVEGTLRDGDEILESSNTTVEFVPSHSERQGGLFFIQDPRQYELQLRAMGYETP